MYVPKNSIQHLHCTGHAVAQLVEALSCKPWRSWVRFSMMSLEFFIDIMVSASKRNEYQEFFLDGKGGRCLRLTNHLHVQIALKHGSLNLLETSGPVQACNGIALPLHTMHVLDEIWRFLKRNYRVFPSPLCREAPARCFSQFLYSF